MKYYNYEIQPVLRLITAILLISKETTDDNKKETKDHWNGSDSRGNPHHYQVTWSTSEMYTKQEK